LTAKISEQRAAKVQEMVQDHFAQFRKAISNQLDAEVKWRRERDSNPRYAFDVNTLSRRAPSTTRPPLRPTSGVWPGESIVSAGNVGREHRQPSVTHCFETHKTPVDG
jgi:hypothetical protein